MSFARMFVLFLVVLRASAIDASCNAHNFSGTDCVEEVPSPGSGMLQMTKAKEFHQSRTEGKGKQLVGRRLGNGSTFSLDESGYQQCAALCCHHEMSTFVQRIIASILSKDVCDISALNGLVHWYDCTNDHRTFDELLDELQKGDDQPCPWLGTEPFCPVNGNNCQEEKFPPCTTPFDPQSEPGISALLTQTGYSNVALRCCDSEMKDFILREIDNQGLEVCDYGALNGLTHWYDCTDDDQTYAKLATEISHAHSGNPCPWLAVKSQPCPARASNCPVIGGLLEGPEPAAHRRRTACR